ncbi:cyclic AMP-responsive element-binding protein 3-like protein 3-A [Salarias fasciatus]|uniref:cyclic AMP-responsive element-binding protein 3-like protein 3-A n=1 Tax=Salarias fasciatus TaxID=181472 RepID=UPI001176873C|nr:cyclic AMP-responsive element-binding protein 3-like protein 3-A [Salarias fasciatus]
MTLTADKVHCDMDIVDLLLKNADESTSCYSNQLWTIPMNDVRTQTPSPERHAADDFLGNLLHGSDSSSVPASPLWSPGTTDSGINEEPLIDTLGSPHSTACTAFPAIDIPAPLQPKSLENRTPGNQSMADVCIDLDWASGGLIEKSEIAYHLTANHNRLVQPALTVKDLLLSNLGQKRIPQHALQELVLNEDEKKLLAKEGVNLPSKFPLSKFEERVLKKIRRKIRNKRSAQESRKKKREYVDCLEGRMSACSAHNLELQRKIHQLEETNNALLERLSQLQALLPNSSSKSAHRGTCILVLLLSFSLLISSNLQPDPNSQLNQAEYAKAKVSSRSLQAVDEVRDVPPPLPPLSISGGFEALRSLTVKLWPWTNLPAAGLSSTHRRDHRLRDDH